MRFGGILAVAAMVAAGTVTGSAQKGNGAPSGPHYNLNIIGVANPKTAVMTDTNGHTIFVPLVGKTNIWLTEADDFSGLQVLIWKDHSSTTSFLDGPVVSTGPSCLTPSSDRPSGNDDESL